MKCYRPTRVFGCPVHEATNDLNSSRNTIDSDGFIINSACKK